MIHLKQTRNKVNTLLVEYKQQKSTIKKEKQEFKKAKLELKSQQEAQEIIQHLAQNIQQYTHTKISGIVSRCLGLVFEESYKFKINFERKRGKTEAVFVFIKDGQELDAASSIGGGVIDLASFALRLSCLILARPQRRRVMILDEPFRFVSRNHRGRLKSMLEILSTELKVQFILVTHDKELMIGKVYDLSE